MTYEPSYTRHKSFSTFDERELAHKAEMLLRAEAPAGKARECRLRDGEKAVAIVTAQELNRLWGYIDRLTQKVQALESKLGYRDQE